MTRDVSPSDLSFAIDNNVATLAINRPPLNILDLAHLRALSSAVRALRDRQDWRVLVVRGLPKAFSAGVAVEDHLPDRIETTLEAFHNAIRGVEAMDRPTIAGVRGHCLGGGMELAMACDVVIASETATFGQPEIKLAAVPPYAVARYADLVGRRRAFADLASGRTFPAKEAMEVGYVTACVSDGELEVEVARMAAAFASLSSEALSTLKRAFLRKDSEESFALAERRYLRELAQSRDAIEGLQAFMEKRQPIWRNRT